MEIVLPPVLLTSCIFVADNAVQLTKPNDRTYHTLESIEQWLHIVPDVKLVVCDSSGFDFAPLVKEKFPHADVDVYFLKPIKIWLNIMARVTAKAKSSNTPCSTLQGCSRHPISQNAQPNYGWKILQSV